MIDFVTWRDSREEPVEQMMAKKILVVMTETWQTMTFYIQYVNNIKKKNNNQKTFWNCQTLLRKMQPDIYSLCVYWVLSCANRCFHVSVRTHRAVKDTNIVEYTPGCKWIQNIGKMSDIPLNCSPTRCNALHGHCWNCTIVCEHLYDSCPC